MEQDQDLRVHCANLERENNALRAALAQSELPCVYCSKPRTDWVKCDLGFPGCSRADDASGCPALDEAAHVGELRELLKRSYPSVLFHYMVFLEDGNAGPQMRRVRKLVKAIDKTLPGAQNSIIEQAYQALVSTKRKLVREQLRHMLTSSIGKTDD